MVRSQSTRPPAKKPNNCPIDNLPSEILHMVCTHLKPTEVANLRLASRVVAPIGLQYLIREVHLVVAEDSFKRLAAIARHAVVSKYVKSLFYEADVLEVLNEKEWKEKVRSPDYRKRLCKGPRYMLRSHRGDFAQARAVPRHQYTKQQLREAFRTYQGFCDYQGRLDQFDSKIAKAMKNFPNLKEFTMSTQVGRPSRAFENVFAPGFCKIYREDMGERPVGLVQMRSLLLGAHHAGLKIERLRCSDVNWRILMENSETFERMKRSVLHLRELSVTFSTGLEEEEDEWGIPQIEKCEKYLQRSRRLEEFVTSAPDLERLEICFEWNQPIQPTELQHVVGDFYWPSLKAVKFEMIGTAENHLVGFFERHASTITDLCMGSLFLSHGCWSSVLKRIRPVLKLDLVDISGSLESSSEIMIFERGSEYELIELRQAIESYLLGDSTGWYINLADFLDESRDDTDALHESWYERWLRYG
ncbi:MAG: hypothetical protein Q9161_008641 [Pseudevernia consocians]